MLQIVVTVGLVGFLSFKHGQKTVNELVNQLMEKASSRVDDRLDHYLALPHKINRINLTAIERQLIDLNDTKRSGQYFWQQAKTFEELSWVGYYLKDSTGGGAGRWLAGQSIVIDENKAGKNYTYTTDDKGNRTNLVHETNYEPTTTESYLVVSQQRKPAWSRIYVLDGFANYVAITASAPIYDKQSQIVGFVGVDLLLSQISDFLKDVNITPHSKIFILERNGLLVANSNKQPIFKKENGKPKRLSALESEDIAIREIARYLQANLSDLYPTTETQNLTITPDTAIPKLSERQFIRVTAWKDEHGLDWLIVIAVPESDFMNEIQANARLTIFLSFFALVLAIWIGVLTSKRIVKPILEAIRVAKSLAKGDWNHSISEDHTIKELGSMAEALNGMSAQLQTAFAKAEYSAHHDALTGLLNRRSFRLKLQAAIARNEENPNELFAVLFLDLDYFKLINDSFGHLVGDSLLIAVAERLQASIKSEDEIARFGGDEFVILLQNIPDVTAATRVADRISHALQQPFKIPFGGDREAFISTSIGIALSTTGGDLPENFLRNADIALYRAKANGKSNYEVFDSDMHAEVMERFHLENDLRRAIERKEFEIYYQPIVSSQSEIMLGFEALVRWHHPTQGTISPDKFIPIIEETGLIIEIGNWILRESCAQMKLWQRQFPNCHSMVLSVNLSSKQFFQPDFLEQIELILKETKLNHNNLKLEITESVLIDRDGTTKAKFTRLRKLGIQLSIDDFGTGYCSLSYLHHFPANTLKIDKSFISRIQPNGDNLEIVEAIVILAHKLGMDVIAEGVETVDQLRHLRAIGCEQLQGYLFSRPAPAWKITKLLFESAIFSTHKSKVLH